MERFTGTIERLRGLVEDAGYRGDWSEIANGHTFRAEDGSILNWFPATGTLQYQGPPDVAARLRATLAGSGEGVPRPAHVEAAGVGGARPRVFVVHGHDETAREQLELILHRLDLQPFVLANTGGGGLTIIEALERETVQPSTRARFGIVLLTPDDVGYSRRDGSDRAEPRARQNVVMEMGMLLAALGRPNVAILKKGHLELPTDAQGIIYIPFNDHVRETVPRLVDRLRNAGFQLDPGAITRASS